MQKASYRGFEKGFSLEKCKARFDVGTIDEDRFGGHSKEYYNPFTKVDKRMDIARKSYETQIYDRY